MTHKTPAAWRKCACGAQASAMYMNFAACPDHTPAKLAGHREPPVPDPTRTAVGLQEAWRARQAQKVEDQRLRSLGLKVFRAASGPHGRYTSADVSYAAVHTAERAVGDILEARRQASLNTRGSS